jgi:hypothetical protein
MTNTMNRARVALLLALVATAACRDGASRHAVDGDTGAAAPATVRDMSVTQGAPDSGSSPTSVARSDSVRARSSDPSGALSTKVSGTPAIKP